MADPITLPDQDEQDKLKPIGQPMANLGPLAASVNSVSPIIQAARINAPQATQTPAFAIPSPGPALAMPSQAEPPPPRLQSGGERLWNAAGNVQNPFARILARTGAGIARAADVGAEGLFPRFAMLAPGSELNTSIRNAANLNKWKEGRALDIQQENAENKPAIEMSKETAAQNRVDTQQEGANTRTAETQAGANARTAETQEGANTRSAGTNQTRLETAGMPGKIAPEIQAQLGPAPTTNQYGGKTYPTVAAAQAAWGKDAENLKNQEAGASGAARGAGYNATRPVQVLDANGNIRYETAGQAEAEGVAPAAEGTKVIGRQAQFNDIDSAIGKVRDALTSAGKTAWTPDQVAKLTMAMSQGDPGVLHNEVTNLAASGLSPAQQDLVAWLEQLQERALSLRNIAGMGQGSDTTRLAILHALPGITSGNTQMATKQLDALQNMVDNLQKGIPSVKGGPERPGAAGGGSKAAPSVGTVVRGWKFNGGDPHDQANWSKVKNAR